MQNSLEGRAVVVTGASSGLGVQFVRALAGAGAVPILAARRIERLQSLVAELGCDAEDAIGCDVTVAADRERLVDTVVARHGSIAGLVNNAGVAAAGPALKLPEGAFAAVLETNLVAPFELSRLAAQAMRTSGGGSIVNLASIFGQRSVDNLPDAAYAASKAGLVGLTRELASQWGRHAVRVNAIAPGFFSSEMNDGLIDPGSGTFPDWLVAGTPLGRTGRKGELDAALLYLLGDGSAFVTGQVLTVDGGLTTR